MICEVCKEEKDDIVQRITKANHTMWLCDGCVDGVALDKPHLRGKNRVANVDNPEADVTILKGEK